jgi:hypothetical protein
MVTFGISICQKKGHGFPFNSNFEEVLKFSGAGIEVV